MPNQTEREKGVLLVVPCDFKHDNTAEVANARLQVDILVQSFRTRVLDFPDTMHSPISKLNSAIAFSSYLFLKGLMGNRFRLLRILSKERGVVWAGFIPIAIITLFFRFVLKLQYSFIFHTNGYPRCTVPKFLYRLVTPLIFHLSDGVITGGMNNSRRFVERYSKRVFLLPPILVETSDFNVSTEERHKLREMLKLENKIGVAVIGPFTSHNRPSINYVKKNLDRFDSRIVFVFIGRFFAEDRVSNSRMRFVGEVNNFAEYLCSLDCALVPIYNKEGAPSSKIVNAMMAGLPVVTDSPENMRVQHGTEILLGNLDELPDLLNDLVSDEAKMREIGMNARKHVAENYSKEKQSESVLRFVREIAAKEGD